MAASTTKIRNPHGLGSGGWESSSGRNGESLMSPQDPQGPVRPSKGQSPRRCLERVTTRIGVPVNSTSSRRRFSMNRK